MPTAAVVVDTIEDESHLELKREQVEKDLLGLLWRRLKELA